MSKGDHVFVWYGVYSHHGIDVGDGTIIHYDNTPWRKLTGGSRDDDRPSIIRQVSLYEFARGREILVREYDCSYVNDLVLERAVSRLGESAYHLFGNNCEHFAVWCKTGQSHSTQIDSFARSARAASRHVPAALALLRLSRGTRGRTRLAMMGLAATITMGTALTRYCCDRFDSWQRGES